MKTTVCSFQSEKSWFKRRCWIEDLNTFICTHFSFFAMRLFVSSFYRSFFFQSTTLNTDIYLFIAEQSLSMLCFTRHHPLVVNELFHMHVQRAFGIVFHEGMFSLDHLSSLTNFCVKKKSQYNATMVDSLKVDWRWFKCIQVSQKAMQPLFNQVISLRSRSVLQEIWVQQIKKKET